MATLRGTEGPDLLVGTADRDTILGGGGDDTLLGGGGFDVISGEAGNDRIEGSAGGNVISGGDGNDTLLGGAEGDTINGDVIGGVAGDDLIHGGGGNDALNGGGANDVVFGEAGDDLLVGDTGADTLFGGAGRDDLSGGDGDDVLYGGGGGDAFRGGNGADWMFAGSAGAVDVQDGAGADTLVLDLPARAFPAFAANAVPGRGLVPTVARPQLGETGGNAINPGFDRAILDAPGLTVRFDAVEGVEFTDGRFSGYLGDVSAQALRLFGAAFGRAPDAGGLSFHVERLADGEVGRPGGADLAAVAADFAASAEFAARYGALGDDGFVAQLYRNVLGREADAGGLGFWTGQVPALGRGGVLAALSESGENVARTRDAVLPGLWVVDPEAAQALRMYDTTLGRLPDRAGLAYWDRLLEDGATTLRGMADAFTGSAEFNARYGALGDRAFVETLYRNTLDREPDAAGVDFWVSQLPAQGRAGVVVGFSESAEHVALTAPLLGNGREGFLLADA